MDKSIIFRVATGNSRFAIAARSLYYNMKPLYNLYLMIKFKTNIPYNKYVEVTDPLKEVLSNKRVIYRLKETRRADLEGSYPAHLPPLLKLAAQKGVSRNLWTNFSYYVNRYYKSISVQILGKYEDEFKQQLSKLYSGDYTPSIKNPVRCKKSYIKVDVYIRSIEVIDFTEN